jgi:NADP-dependent 3-hydroxy acid dehydrogenase YdfG
VSLVEPGAVDTELSTHVRPEIREQLQARLVDMKLLHASDIADAIAYILTRDREVAVNEVLLRPTRQDR